MFGFNLSRYVYKLLLLTIAIFATSPVLADVPDGTIIDGAGVDTGPGSVCASMKTVTETPLYVRTSRGQNEWTYNKFQFHRYDPNTLVHFQNVSGDYAEVEVPMINGFCSVDSSSSKPECPTKTMYAHKSHFSSKFWEAARKLCSGEATPGDDFSTGFLEKGHKLSSASTDGNVPAELKANFDKAFCNLKNFYNEKNRREGYAYINVPNGFKFRTFVVDLKSGKVVDQFDSLMSPHRMGCARNHTRPGIFKLSDKFSPGTKKRSWWGTGSWRGRNYRAPAFVITNVGGHKTQYGGGGDGHLCRSNHSIKAHMNINMRGADSAGRRYSHGCFITSKKIFEKWTKGQAGNALIVNFDPNRALHPNCQHLQKPKK